MRGTMGPDRRELAAVFAGGFVGAVLLRAELAEALPPAAGRLAWATFATNVSGDLPARACSSRGCRSACRRSATCAPC